MASPVFKSSKEFQPGASLEANQMGTQTADLQAQFDQPAATGFDTGRMSYEGTITKAAGIGLLVLLFAIPGYMFPNYPLMIVGAIGGFVLALVNVFKKKPSPLLIALYAVAEGYFLGAITKFIEDSYENLGNAGLQALAATLVTFGVCLALYKSGKVRYTKKLQKILIIGGVSYLVFSLVNVGFMLFASPDGLNDGGWGLRSSITVLGIPLGVLIGLVAVFLACISLIGDFDFIENGVKNRLPDWVEWKAAFGLILTLVWLYIEFLRIIAILFGRR